jgi:hypothetical protein
MKSLKGTKTIVLSLMVLSLIFGVHLMASAASTKTLEVTGTVTRGGIPVEAGYTVVITNIDKPEFTETTATNPDGTYAEAFFDLFDPVAETGDVIQVVVTDPDTAEEAQNTETYQSGNSMTIDVDFPAALNQGLVEVFQPGPPTWVYTLTHISGTITEWTYYGAAIVTANIVAGSSAEAAEWDVDLTGLPNQVRFFATADPMTGGLLGGFAIHGPEEGTGSWICHDSSGPIEGPLPVVFSGFTVHYDAPKSQVILKWSTESEINNLGFDVYRSGSPEGQFVKVNSSYIKGAGTNATPHDYQFVDESAVVGKTYYYYLETISFSGERERSHIIKVIVDVSGKVKVTGLMQPTTFALLQNFPNPFNPETWIPFHLVNDADVTIRIFDIRGQEIRIIHLGQRHAGYYDTKGKAVLWDGRDNYGQEVSSGIYFYSLTAGKFHATKKLTIIK